jgi:hypothetical protein
MINHWMFRCKDISQKVSLSMDTPLPYHQRTSIQVHMMMCSYCARFRSQLMMLRKASCQIDSDPSGTSITEPLSQEAKNRIKQNLRSL